MSNRFVFLDRDGTLVEDHGFVHRLSDYALLPGTIEALQLLRRSGFRLAIVTNQSGIGRGIFGTDDFWAFQRRLLEDLAAADVHIEETYVCPHRPEDGCDCRKPRPGLVWQARDRFSIDLRESWVIGDHASDVALGVAAGCRSVLVLTGHGAEERARVIAAPGPPALIVADVLDAARHIVGGQAD